MDRIWHNSGAQSHGMPSLPGIEKMLKIPSTSIHNSLTVDCQRAMSVRVCHLKQPGPMIPGAAQACRDSIAIFRCLFPGRGYTAEKRIPIHNVKDLVNSSTSALDSALSTSNTIPSSKAKRLGRHTAARGALRPLLQLPNLFSNHPSR